MKNYPKILSLSLCLFGLMVCNGATQLVTNTNDSGPGSLREAILNANNADKIKISPTLLSGGSDTIHLESTIDITKGLFIEGTYNSTDTIFISGGDSVQIFNIDMPSNAVYYHMTFDSVVAINGRGQFGGFAYLDYYYTLVDWIVTINDCVFRNNYATNSGGVFSTGYSTATGKGTVRGSHFIIRRSNFIGNSANSRGGALYINSYTASNLESQIQVDIEYSNFMHNSAGSSGGAIYTYIKQAYGGWTYYPEGVSTNIDLVRSSMCYNSAGTTGGAIYQYADGNGPTLAGNSDETHLLVSYSTLVENSAISHGGAIMQDAEDEANLRINYSTLVENTSFTEGSAFYNICRFLGNGKISLFSNIIALNDGNPLKENNMFNDGVNQSFTKNYSSGYNVLELNQTMNLYTPSSDDYEIATTSNLPFEPLALNDFGTYTLIPMSGNVAINAGATSAVEDAQNGPILGVRDVGAAESDICGYIPVELKDTICSSESINFNGKILTEEGMYFDTVPGSGGCDTAFTFDLKVNESVVPEVSLTIAPNNIVMEGTEVDFTVTVINGGTSPSYEWYLNNVPQGVDGPAVTSSNLANGTEIYCVVNSSALCANPISVHSDTIQMTVHKNNDEPCDAIEMIVFEDCNFSFFNNDGATDSPLVGDNSCAPGSGSDIWIKYRAPSTNDIAFTTLQGTMTDAVVTAYEGDCATGLFESGCIDNVGWEKMPYGTISQNETGEYYYLRISSWETGSFAICLEEITDSTLSVGEPITHTKNTIQMFPNPASKEIQVSSSGINMTEVVMFNSLGQEVQRQVLQGLSQQLDVSTLEAGVYYAHILMEDGGVDNIPVTIVR